MNYLKNNRCYDKLGVHPQYIKDLIVALEVGHRGAISDDYVEKIADKCLNDVISDMVETSDMEEWNDDDVRLAFGRTLVKRLKIS